ncbi:MAG: low molecular weight phosphotyrosine protein phosphatase [Rhodospirillales bacterium]|nr:low molecular weight phosphotyrosine protein phosphatase [Rhodospirillales bacterium]MBO6787786.1 low molecular weight phosphotyrosine protein phosphatase [Rhodospirillales bacterium]
MVRVLFVCLGNICRSPTAEGVFRDLVRREGLVDLIVTDSCGTGGWHAGDPPDSRACAEAESRGIEIRDLRARQVRKDDFGSFDYVLGMDDGNIQNLLAMCPPEFTDRVKLFLSFAPEVGRHDVPDPYYGGPDGFRKVFDMIDKASHGLLADIRTRHLDAR